MCFFAEPTRFVNYCRTQQVLSLWFATFFLWLWSERGSFLSQSSLIRSGLLRTSTVLSGRALNELLVVSFASSCWKEADDRKILIFCTREDWQFILGNTYLIVATIQQAAAAGVTIFPKPLLVDQAASGGRRSLWGFKRKWAAWILWDFMQDDAAAASTLWCRSRRYERCGGPTSRVLD